MRKGDFRKHVKEALVKRVGYMCSNPDCNKHTSGPHIDNDKAAIIGVAAHITAASEGGPRYEENLSSIGRKSALNGIWLCENCATMIDKDPMKYSVVKLFDWKSRAELLA